MKKPSNDRSKTRERVLEILSGVAVSSARSTGFARDLLGGDEYLDLAHLDRGVQRARGPEPVDGLLLRKAVTDDTWAKILLELPRLPRTFAN